MNWLEYYHDMNKNQKHAVDICKILRRFVNQYIHTRLSDN